MDTIKIQMASEADAQELLEIYRPYVEKTAISFEYTVPPVTEFQNRIRSTLKQFPYLKAVCEGKIAGYAYASPFKQRAAYGWAVETSIYVRQDARGHGIGAALYRVLEEILRRQHVINVNACIVYPHPESIRFHERLGYRTVAHFTKCGYKHNAWHDMVWMEKFLSPHPDMPQPVIPVSQLDLTDLFPAGLVERSAL